MLEVVVDRHASVADKIELFSQGPIGKGPGIIEPQSDDLLDRLISDLSPKASWGDRRKAARKLGDLANPAAVSGLLTALPADPFWMVRCNMIQALERIGDPRAIATLQRVEKEDAFLTVRCHAAKAIETLVRNGI